MHGDRSIQKVALSSDHGTHSESKGNHRKAIIDQADQSTAIEIQSAFSTLIFAPQERILSFFHRLRSCKQLRQSQVTFKGLCALPLVSKSRRLDKHVCLDITLFVSIV